MSTSKLFKTPTYLRGLATSLLLACGFIGSTVSYADENNAAVDIPSLKVKERLHSMEQINVTAEKPQQDIEPDSEAVQALLREADQLDAEPSAVVQPAAH